VAIVYLNLSKVHKIFVCISTPEFSHFCLSDSLLHPPWRQ